MNAPALRPRAVGEILDTAFQLYRSRWKEMALATGVLVLPVLLLKVVAPLAWLGLVDQLGQLFFLAASAAVVVIAAGAYRGESVDAVDAIRQVRSRFLSVWGAAIFQGLIVFLGMLLLIVPGVIALAYTFGMQQAVMIEGRRTNGSWERSRELARGNIVRILLTIVLAFVIVFVALIGVGALVGLLPIGVRMATLLVTTAMIGLNPLPAVVGTVMYYDLRIRKEAYDVAQATDRLEATAPVAAF